MQSFASPPSFPPHTKITHHKSNTTFYTTPHKKGATITYPYALSTQKIHRKGATIAYTHALSTQKTTKRAQLSPIPTPFLPKNP